ncbi:Unconventional myosin-IXa [Mactra antiquata]
MESVTDKFSAMALNIKHLKPKITETKSDPITNKKWSEMSMTSSTGDTRKTGWLRKQGGMVKSWHRRWFVLNGDYLFYFGKEDDSKPLGMIYLIGNKIIQHPANPEEPDKFLLELVPGRAPTKAPSNQESFLLCAASDDERQDWIKAIRKVMFASKGGAIFGTALEETMKFEKTRSDRKVPLIVEACIEFLTENALETEGIFRLPGRMLLVRDLKDRYDEGEKVVLSPDDVDIHSVASLLKQYLRELPECLIPYKFYQEFMNIAMKFQGAKCNDNKLELVESLRTAVVDLPVDNYNVLKCLCNFLHKVSNNTHINKMSSQNLARVFGPNIIRHPQMEDNPEVFMLTTADISEQLAYMMFDYEDRIFTIDYDNNSCAVDDLLQLEETDTTPDGILQPISGNTNGSSGVNELSDIVFEQRRDRRARSFQTPDLMLELSNNIDIGEPGSSDSSPTVDKPVPVRRNASSKPSLSEDGRPIPPLRRKYTREHRILNAERSNSSVSSDHSSENSLDFADNGSAISLPQTPNTAMLELQQRLETMTAEHDALKARYENLNASKTKSDERVKNLSAEMSKIQTRYEEHIKNVEKRHKTQIEDLSAKLCDERTGKADAIKKIMELQKTIQKYQMHYGDLKDKLPPLYP